MLANPSVINRTLSDQDKQKQIIRLLFQEAFHPIKEEMQILNQEIMSFLPAESDSAQQVISHVFSEGGKRIRPALFFMCCRLVSYKGPYLIPMGAVCEYIHTASLLHDDVIDNSSLRRGRPSGNAIWGDATAVLVGDLIYARASEMMANTGNIEVVKSFARAIRKMSDGEILQLDHGQVQDFGIQEYFKILAGKTAVLIGSICKVAGLLANQSTQHCESLYQFGFNIGLAFQLLDDALDYLSNGETLGKKQYQDFFESKMTMPVLLLKDALSPAEWLEVDAIFQNQHKSQDDLAVILKLIKDKETAVKTMELAHEYTDKATTELNIFPQSVLRSDLIHLANLLAQRIF